jgi:hypothetical protein
MLPRSFSNRSAFVSGIAQVVLHPNNSIHSMTSNNRNNRNNRSNPNHVCPGPESKAGANAGECALCLEPVEEPSYTLVLCGHTFCKDCIEPQMTAADKFPVCCPKEGCTRPLAWRDVESICDAKALTAITNASYQSFRCANLKLFPNCMGLNCSQVFHKDDQHAFCDQCNTDYCIPCCSRRGAATPAHPGRTCAQQEGALNHDALFEQVPDTLMAMLTTCSH